MTQALLIAACLSLGLPIAQRFEDWPHLPCEGLSCWWRSDAFHSNMCMHRSRLNAQLQELDEAARRRLPKQLYIPLPCSAARAAMVQRALGPTSSVAAHLPPDHLARIVARTAGYSGAHHFSSHHCCSVFTRPMLSSKLTLNGAIAPHWLLLGLSHCRVCLQGTTFSVVP